MCNEKTDLDNSDRDDNNPVDMTSDDWAEFYSKRRDFDDYLDNDHSMDN